MNTIMVAVKTTRAALEALLDPSPSPHEMLTGLEDLRAALRAYDDAPGEMEGMRLVVAAHVTTDPDLGAIAAALASTKADGTIGATWAMDLAESPELIAQAIVLLSACGFDGPLEAVLRLAPNAAAAQELIRQRLGDDPDEEAETDAA